MESRKKHLVNQVLKKKHQHGRKVKEAGSVIPHAATAVADGNKGDAKHNMAMKKMFAKYRGYYGFDQGLHHYAADMEHEKYKES